MNIGGHPTTPGFRVTLESFPVPGDPQRARNIPSKYMLYWRIHYVDFSHKPLIQLIPRWMSTPVVIFWNGFQLQPPNGLANKASWSRVVRFGRFL